MLRCCDYSERLVASFAHQIKSEYCGNNRYLSIEGIAFEHFSAPTQNETATTPQSRKHRAMIHSFL